MPGLLILPENKFPTHFPIVQTHNNILAVFSFFLGCPFWWIYSKIGSHCNFHFANILQIFIQLKYISLVWQGMFRMFFLYGNKENGGMKTLFVSIHSLISISHNPKQFDPLFPLALPCGHPMPNFIFVLVCLFWLAACFEFNKPSKLVKILVAFKHQKFIAHSNISGPDLHCLSSFLEIFGNILFWNRKMTSIGCIL